MKRKIIGAISVVLLSTILCLNLNSISEEKNKSQICTISEKTIVIGNSIVNSGSIQIELTDNDDMDACEVDDEKETIIEKEAKKKTYVASKNSRVYHRKTCRSAKRIKSYNRRYFSTKKEAKKYGYRACKVCKP